jgi:formamidopyrimidine-DNA glycosylase
MPELPEVETTRRGILPALKGHRVTDVVLRHSQLRWPIPLNLPLLLKNQEVLDVQRRGKYLLLIFHHGTVLIHLGMSGHLKLLPLTEPYKKHDHVILVLDGQISLRFHDPRRFGAWLWTSEPPLEHPLLCELGPEPLSEDFSADYLQQALKNRTAPIKQLLMDSHLVVGVGNIYANEALFQARILPTMPGQQLKKPALKKLVTVTQQILQAAIQQGGTTLKDFSQSDGNPGYFSQHLFVYGRANQPCYQCKTLLVECRLGQRSTVYCPRCQR